MTRMNLLRQQLNGIWCLTSEDGFIKSSVIYYFFIACFLQCSSKIYSLYHN